MVSRETGDVVTGDVPEVTSVEDPLTGDPAVARFFGEAWPAVAGFHSMLVDEGVLRGLVGPREVSRLWSRHLLNSAAVVPFLPTSGRIVDLGSGAGLPGIVVAAMRPECEVVLLEPMERRTDWLAEVAQRLHLDNVVVERNRAQDVHGHLMADAVTARAVASLDKLYRMALPMLRAGGVLVALKGEKAEQEVQDAKHVGKKWGAGVAEVVVASTIDGVEPTRVVRVVREVANVR
ncbi:16S rRNA (guanine(527)-N(7))-methyltransferase RsmG [Cellulomonas fimi]|uniref:16S rRNA (guanine(527)-N(7))-methyltransferase RsmG n=1 Tax=Cellulomonas fimi TaxID=1708 RepID=UPI00234D73B0|nr:16S rRNA (guanine(527)-N(7))-methyltransferase RsmG [Cellulomonas fimi]MDC7121848.1 16S rRNA (guanine(527)-N(7))-methyltransferase RsmG [Cellulomonas fimi]